VILLEFMAVKPCRFDSYEVVPKNRLSLDLTDCEAMLAGAGYEIVANEGVMLVTRKVVEITLYPHGRLLLQPVKHKDDAEKIAGQFYRDLGL